MSTQNIRESPLIQARRLHRSHLIREIHKDQDETTRMETLKDQAEANGETVDALVEAEELKVWLVVQRRPLSEKPFVWRWLARLVYRAIGWSSEVGVEYQGVYTEESAARHASSADGWSYTELPLNGDLPAETCQYGTHDFPLSEASQEYRNRRLVRISVPYRDVVRLQEKIRLTDSIVEQFRTKTV